MAGLDDIINMTITIESSTITREGFGTPLVLDYNSRFTDSLVRSYSGVKGMVEDGFATTDQAYIALNAMFSQNPRPGIGKVGRKSTAVTQIYEITPATAVSTTYAFGMAITGGSTQLVRYIASATANAAEILNGLTAAVAALQAYGAAGLTAATATGLVRITAPAGAVKFGIQTKGAVGTAKLTPNAFTSFQNVTTDASTAADLNAIELEDSDWYGFMMTSKGKAENIAAAGWVQSRRKFFVAGTLDSDVKGSGSSDLASSLKASAYTRTALFWNDKINIDHGDAAFLGKWLPYDPGSETMKFKELSGPTTTKLTDTELANLRSKNVNCYTAVAGAGSTEEGKTCQGEFMDVVRFADWLYYNIQVGVYDALRRALKIPYTDPGVSQVEAPVRAVLSRGVQKGGLAASPEPTVSFPAVSSVSTVDRGARLLPDGKFTGTLAGAIHKLEIDGTISV